MVHHLQPAGPASRLNLL